MNAPVTKQKYESPKIYRVVLNHDQAVLSGCTTTTTSSSGTGSSCRTGSSGCRQSTSSTSINSASNS